MAELLGRHKPLAQSGESARRQGRVQLLDLPLDVIKTILKEVRQNFGD